jgi:hypothetical protein
VDRKALPEPDRTDQQSAYQAPRNDIERLLCELWQELLGLERVGITDDFFNLGGHSLLIMPLLSRLAEQGFSASVRGVFMHPRLADLAAFIAGNDATPHFQVPENRIPPHCDQLQPEMLPLVSLTADDINQIVAQVPGGAANVQDIYPLAPLQEGMLFHHLLDKENDPYILPVQLRFEDRDALRQFEAAMGLIIARHDALRTAVLWKNISTPVQVVYRTAQLPVEEIELDASQDANAHIQRLYAAKQWLDMSRAPLIRLVIAKEPDSGQYHGLLQMHLFVSDHIGLEIIQREYAAYLAGQFDKLPPALAYRDFVALTLQQTRQDEAKRFFSRMLGDVDEPTLPFNLSDLRGDGYQHQLARSLVPPAITERVLQLAQQLHLSPAIFFHAAWAMVLTACSGRQDVVFGTVLSGRMQGMPGIEHTLGLFLNTLPLRVKLDDHSAMELVQDLHQRFSELLNHEQYSLSQAQAQSGLPKDVPLFSALLNYRHSKVDEAASSLHNSGINFIAAREHSNYPLNLTVDNFGEAFAWEVQIDASQSAERILAYMEAALSNLLEALIYQPNQTASSLLSISPEQEHRQLAVSSKTTQAPHAHNDTQVTQDGEVDSPPLPLIQGKIAQQRSLRPKSKTEMLLAGLWAENLAISSHNIHMSSDYFHLGGNSLLALDLINRINHAFRPDRDLTLLDLLENSVFFDLLKYL